MKKIYLIYDLVSQKYFNNFTKSFGVIDGATKYEFISTEDIEEAEECSTTHFCLLQIVECFKK